MHLVFDLSILQQCNANAARCMTTTAGEAILELDYPRVFATAIAPSIASCGKRFRYLHVTGAMVERDQKKSLWMKGSVRKIKVRTIGSQSGIDRSCPHSGVNQVGEQSFVVLTFVAGSR
jgi:hypothetical protein